MISYWDTSALIPCFLKEEKTAEMVIALKGTGKDTARFTSWLSVFEFEGVLRRKLNQKLISTGEYEMINQKWMTLQASLNFLPLDNRVARMGLRLQKLYSMRPYDSIQLGSACLLQLEYPELTFVCLDHSLSEKALCEGLQLNSHCTVKLP